MYCTEELAMQSVCWKSIGSAKGEHKCYGTRCMGWEWVVDQYFINSCPHCHRTITGIDLKGVDGVDPIGSCKSKR